MMNTTDTHDPDGGWRELAEACTGCGPSRPRPWPRRCWSGSA